MSKSKEMSPELQQVFDQLEVYRANVKIAQSRGHRMGLTTRKKYDYGLGNAILWAKEAAAYLEQLVEALSDLEMDIEGGHEKVRIYAE